MAKPRVNTKKSTHNTKEAALENLDLALKARKEMIAREHSEPILLQVRDLDHARSEEVLLFCMKQLEKGVTYNALRCQLGLGTAATDFRWRAIRQTLTEMVLPTDEEDALLSANSLSAYLLKRMEEFVDKTAKRAVEMRGDKNEFQYLKLELDAMRVLTEKYEARTEHYLKMKDLQKQEKGRHGQTVVFNNKFYVARPGDAARDVTLGEAAELSGRLHELDEKNE